MFVGELESADIAALLSQSAHQSDRVGAKLLEVAMLILATGDPANLLHGRVAGHGSSGYLSCWRSSGALDSGASGCSSIEATNPPRGVSATNAIARARSAARRK